MIDVIILAIVQAITEFVPVSSSGHLIAVEELTSVESFLALDVILHAGTLIALTVFFWPKLMSIVKSFSKKNNKKLAINIIVTTVPAALFGFFLRDVFDDARQLEIVIIMLAAVGALMILADKLFEKTKAKKINTLGRDDAWFIGLGQALALIPGTSRSGITMLAGRAKGLNNKEAAEYAFLVGIPIIFGATVNVLSESATRTYIENNADQVIVGVVVAASLGWLALKVLLRYLSDNGLAVFGWYRVALAGVLFIILQNQ